VSFEAVYGLLYLGTVVMMVVSSIGMKNFLSSTSVIADQVSLDRFKGVARLNMYLALVQILLMVPQMVIGIVLIFRYGLPALVVVLGVNGVIFFAGKKLKVFEERARSMPAESEELAEEHRWVSVSWVKKALPDF